MKIFPPLSEIIWPPGLSAKSALWARRYPLAVIAALALTALAWSFAGPGNIGGTLNASLIKVPGSQCSTLQFDRSAAAVTAMPCKAFEMKPGRSVVAGRALPREALPARPTQLTAADRAIKAPARFRPTLSQHGASRPGRTTENPAIAQSPAAE